MGDGGVGGGDHTAAHHGPGSLPLPRQADNAGGEDGEGPGGSHHLNHRHNSRSSASAVPPERAASRSIYREVLASQSQGPTQVENTRSVIKWMELFKMSRITPYMLLVFLSGLGISLLMHQ